MNSDVEIDYFTIFLKICSYRSINQLLNRKIHLIVGCFILCSYSAFLTPCCRVVALKASQAYGDIIQHVICSLWPQALLLEILMLFHTLPSMNLLPNSPSPSHMEFLFYLSWTIFCVSPLIFSGKSLRSFSLIPFFFCLSLYIPLGF